MVNNYKSLKESLMFLWILLRIKKKQTKKNLKMSIHIKHSNSYITGHFTPVGALNICLISS